jgi:transposase-like protein
MTLAQAAEALERHRLGETKTALADEYGLSRRALSDWLAKAADEEARAAAPPDSGVQRTPREVLQAILNNAALKAETQVAAAKAMDALSAKTLDGGEDVARPESITLSGPAFCPGCGLDLADVREIELDLIIGSLSAEQDAGTAPAEPDIAPLAPVVPIHGHEVIGPGGKRVDPPSTVSADDPPF